MCVPWQINDSLRISFLTLLLETPWRKLLSIKIIKKEILANNVVLVANYNLLVVSRTRYFSRFGRTITPLIGRETTNCLGGSEQRETKLQEAFDCVLFFSDNSYLIPKWTSFFSLFDCRQQNWIPNYGTRQRHINTTCILILNDRPR